MKKGYDPGSLARARPLAYTGTMSGQEEWFDVVDLEGRVVSKATRSECHGNPSLIHQAVHVLVFNHAGALFLQQRSPRKDIQPGKWDTSVGGHLALGEAPREAAIREMTEELGVVPGDLYPAYRYLWKSPVETEWIVAFHTRHDGPFQLQAEELADGRFWSLEEIETQRNRDVFTPQFEQEFSRMKHLHHSLGFSS